MYYGSKFILPQISKLRLVVLLDQGTANLISQLLYVIQDDSVQGHDALNEC